MDKRILSSREKDCITKAILNIESSKSIVNDDLEVEVDGNLFVVTFVLNQSFESVVGTTDEYGNEERYTETHIECACVDKVILLAEDKNVECEIFDIAV